MTREEQIKHAAYSRYAIVSSPLECNCFIEGAKWADKTMIGKACKWLEKHVENFMPPTNSFHDYNTGEFIHFFKKAMEE